jgi:hypothetical protein
MSNLVEKILLTGFSFFVILLFLTNLIPIFNNISIVRNNEIDAMNKYIKFSSELDYCLNLIDNKSIISYTNYVEPPEGLNVTISSNFIILEIKFVYFYQKDIFFYKTALYPISFTNLESKKYLLNVKNKSNYILINLSLINQEK